MGNVLRVAAISSHHWPPLPVQIGGHRAVTQGVGDNLPPGSSAGCVGSMAPCDGPVMGSEEGFEKRPPPPGPI